MLKTCNRCRQSKPPEEFHKDRAKKDGLCGKCKACNKSGATKWYYDNQEDGRRTRSEYYHKNKDRYLATCKSYRDKNLEKCRTMSRNYRRENREKKLAIDMAWRAKNPERVKLYRVANESKRRAAKLASCGTYTAQDIVGLFAKQKRKCICCLRKLDQGYHVDHIYPLSKGGSNSINNIQLLCPPCNIKKSAKDPIQFMQENGFLL